LHTATSGVGVTNSENSKGCTRKCALSVSWLNYSYIRYGIWHDIFVQIWYM